MFHLKKYVSFLKNVCATQYLRKSAVRYINKVEYTELMGVYSLTVRCSGPPYRRWTGGMMHFYLFKGLQWLIKERGSMCEIITLSAFESWWLTKIFRNSNPASAFTHTFVKFDKPSSQYVCVCSVYVCRYRTLLSKRVIEYVKNRTGN